MYSQMTISGYDCWKRKGLSRRRKLENVGAETTKDNQNIKWQENCKLLFTIDGHDWRLFTVKGFVSSTATGIIVAKALLTSNCVGLTAFSVPSCCLSEVTVQCMRCHLNCELWDAGILSGGNGNLMRNSMGMAIKMSTVGNRNERELELVHGNWESKS